MECIIVFYHVDVGAPIHVIYFLAILSAPMSNLIFLTWVISSFKLMLTFDLIIKINYFTETKKLTEIENDTSSLSILDVKNDMILFSRTSLVDYPRLFIGRFDNNNLSRVLLNQVSAEIKAIDFSNIKYEFNEYQYNNKEEVRKYIINKIKVN